MRAQVFATTRWTVVMAAGRNSSPAAREAMEALCKTYWYPLYAFVRRAGHSAHDAQDLTQSFFERFLEKNFLGDIHRDRGKFRSFLLAALKHFLANEWDRAHAQKRGGKVAFISIDEQTAEERYRLEPADHLTAEKIYARRWACTLLDNVLELLKEEFKKAGKAAEFARMKVFLSGERASLPYAEMAPKLGMSEAALKVAVHRVRKRYRELLRAEIAQTLENPADVDSEIRELYAALGN
jgi:RNA polymerase sigma-70 factor (ECF subfamily)